MSRAQRQEHAMKNRTDRNRSNGLNVGTGRERSSPHESLSTERKKKKTGGRRQRGDGPIQEEGPSSKVGELSGRMHVRHKSHEKKKPRQGATTRL